MFNLAVHGGGDQDGFGRQRHPLEWAYGARRRGLVPRVLLGGGEPRVLDVLGAAWSAKVLKNDDFRVCGQLSGV
jgi:hypothetical protein